MKYLARTCIAGGLVAFSSGAYAEFSGNVALTNDYVFRGISQTDEDPAIQGGFDFAHDSGFYAGVWASNVDFNDGDEAHIEIDVYGGIAGAFTDNFGWDLGVIYYAYPGADSSLDYDFFEIVPAISYDFGVAAVSASAAYSPEFFGDTGEAVYSSLNVDIPVGENFGVGLHVGYQDIEDAEDYTDYGVSVSTSAAGFDFSLGYTDTDISDSDCDDICDGRVVFTVARGF